MMTDSPQLVWQSGDEESAQQVLAEAFMGKFRGDSISETRRNYQGHINTVGPRLRWE